MSRVKGFLSFINEGKQQMLSIGLMSKNIEVAYEKDAKDVMYGGDDGKFYNFYVIDADMDNASVAAKVLEDPGIFGERVLFAPLDLTVKSYSKLKDAGIEIPKNANFVMHVMIAKKNPAPYKGHQN